MARFLETISSTGIGNAGKLIVAVGIFGSLAGIGHATPLSPKQAQLLQSSVIVSGCTQLEISAGIILGECGTLSDTEVEQRLKALIDLSDESDGE